MAVDARRFKEIDRKEMGRRIRERREKLGINREKLAEHLDVSPQFIADIEYGNKGISIKSLYTLSQVLMVTADYILAGRVYDLDCDAEAMKVEEEIISLIHKCSAEQLRGIRDIAEIYVDRIRK